MDIVIGKRRHKTSARIIRFDGKMYEDAHCYTDILRKIRIGSKRRKTGFAIGNTSEYLGKVVLSYSGTETDKLIYGGVIVRRFTAGAIARIIDGKTDYVFVDAEKEVKRFTMAKNDVGNIGTDHPRHHLKSKYYTTKEMISR
jgi:hypothetical protein